MTSPTAAEGSAPMRRADAMAVLAAVRAQDDTAEVAVILGPGAACADLLAHGHRPPTIYNMELGYAAPMCLGVALARPDVQVVAVEGDGSLLAGCPSLVTIARVGPPNLIVLAIDNGVYESVVPHDHPPTGTRQGVSLAALGVACGLPPGQVVEASDQASLQAALRRGLQEPGPWLIVATVAPGSAMPPVPEDLKTFEPVAEFRQHLAAGAR
jgi:thiamine pyrophosphate-dependent acetolactate synthase large subunit-like protein